MEDGQIQGLLSLLTDDSEGVRDKVTEHLKKLGPEGLKILATARGHADPTVRDQAIKLRRALAIEWSSSVLEEQSEAAEPDLLTYHLHLSVLDDPDIEVSHLEAQIADLRRTARERLTGATTLIEKAQALSEYLCGEVGFIGDGDNYDDLRNSYLHHVLERRKGIPISLSAIYLLVGRAAGLRMSGVGMPCQFLVRIESEDDDLLIDPYGGGRILDHDNTKALLSGFEPRLRKEYLRSVTDRALLTRALANLIRVYDGRGQYNRLQRVANLMAALQSDRA